MSQDAPSDACMSKVNEILTSEESIIFSVSQTSIAGLKPDTVVLTNKRFILYHPGLLGCKFDDFLWRDLINVKLNEGIMGAKLTFEAKNNKITVDNSQKLRHEKPTQSHKKRNKKLMRIDDKDRCKKIQPKPGILLLEMLGQETNQPQLQMIQWQSLPS